MTHVVWQGGDEKVLYEARAGGKKVVSPKWIEASAKRGRWVEEAAFELRPAETGGCSATRYLRDAEAVATAQRKRKRQQTVNSRTDRAATTSRRRPTARRDTQPVMTTQKSGSSGSSETPWWPQGPSSRWQTQQSSQQPRTAAKTTSSSQAGTVLYSATQTASSSKNSQDDYYEGMPPPPKTARATSTTAGPWSYVRSTVTTAANAIFARGTTTGATTAVEPGRGGLSSNDTVREHHSEDTTNHKQQKQQPKTARRTIIIIDDDDDGEVVATTTAKKEGNGGGDDDAKKKKSQQPQQTAKRQLIGDAPMQASAAPPRMLDSRAQPVSARDRYWDDGRETSKGGQSRQKRKRRGNDSTPAYALDSKLAAAESDDSQPSADKTLASRGPRSVFAMVDDDDAAAAGLTVIEAPDNNNNTSDDNGFPQDTEEEDDKDDKSDNKDDEKEDEKYEAVGEEEKEEVESYRMVVDEEEEKSEARPRKRARRSMDAEEQPPSVHTTEEMDVVVIDDDDDDASSSASLVVFPFPKKTKKKKEVLSQKQANVVISASGLDEDMRLMLKQLSSGRGSKRSRLRARFIDCELLTILKGATPPKATHLVVPTGEKPLRTLKVLFALARGGTFVVTADWVSDSVTADKWLEPAGYLTSFGPPRTGTKLFKNTNIHVLASSLGPGDPAHAALTALVAAAGAKSSSLRPANRILVGETFSLPKASKAVRDAAKKGNVLNVKWLFDAIALNDPRHATTNYLPTS